MGKRVFLLLLIICSMLNTYSQNAYEAEIQQWKKDRLGELKSENGWLNLAGLFWIKEGKQYFGGTTQDDIRFPISSFPAQVGYFERRGNIVRMVIEKEIAILYNGVRQKEGVVFDEDSLHQSQMSFAHYRWTLLKRDELIGIRFRDLQHPAITSLQSIPCFPLDTTYCVKAKFIPALIPTKIGVANVLGQLTQQFSPGKLVFNLKGKSYSLDALQEGDKLFIVFGDRTNGQITYASGRYLYAAMPGEDGLTILDFNKAYNPPCVFTSFATCLLPPKQNLIDIAIKAGEMKTKQE